ncbi:peroxiredoxin [bacterium]|nr:peroxiredoxin [bacterium]
MATIGQIAPDFTLPNQDGTFISLSQLKGRWVVLYFYPKDDTPGCTREGIEFSEKKERFTEKNATVMGVSRDSQHSHQRFCQKYKLTIDLLSDTDNTMIDAYGFWKEKNTFGKIHMGIVRSTVLINPDGVIHQVWTDVKVDGHVDQVLASL